MESLSDGDPGAKHLEEKEINEILTVQIIFCNINYLNVSQKNSTKTHMNFGRIHIFCNNTNAAWKTKFGYG